MIQHNMIQQLDKEVSSHTVSAPLKVKQKSSGRPENCPDRERYVRDYETHEHIAFCLAFLVHMLCGSCTGGMCHFLCDVNVLIVIN